MEKKHNLMTWSLFIVGAVICSIISYRYFPQAFPLIHLDISMNRTQAVKKAEAIAQQFSLGPTEAQVATSFDTDEKIKTFIELEAGGKEALVAMMKHDLYQPYVWHVRLFKPFEQREAIIAFTPNGTPYGYKEKLSDHQNGNSLSSEQALKKAEKFIQADPWKIDLSTYTLVETSQATVLSGRIDHTFVYERNNATIGEGFYRFKVTISGDKPTELTHYVKEPEAFSLRYQEMRSKNENIAYLGTLLMIILYGLGCAFIGLFYLIKRRMLIWRPALFLALCISLGVVATMINKLPLYWMSYNTSFSPINFLLQIGINGLYNFIFLSLIFTIVFATAEGLTRAAFPTKIQFWQMWHTPVASSYTLLGYVVGAFLLIPYLLTYVISFYLFTTKQFNWWIPSSSLFDPNILATYFPWLESLALSFQAGFFEECLFRALPLSAAALLGNRFGKKQWWIAAAFLIQIFIFGAAHANYPAQPSYARLVELIFFSAFLGGIYLRFGLLPGILAHFGYDVFLFALPVLVSFGTTALLNKIIIVILTLIPLWIVCYARLKTGSWHTISAADLNSAFQSAPVSNNSSQPTETTSISLNSTTLRLWIATGICSVIAWGFATRFVPDNPPLHLSRKEVVEKAQVWTKDSIARNWNNVRYLSNPFITFDSNPSVRKQHRYIWQQEKQLYPQLIGSYLSSPHWIVRLSQFEGPLLERAEEFALFYNPDGTQIRTLHKIPEQLPGASLSQQEAVDLAYEKAQSLFNLAPNNLTLKTAQSEKQPARLDWNITLRDNTISLKEGEAHIKINIAGNEVADASRMIHIPEHWEKKEENKLLLSTIINKLSFLLLYLLALAAAIIILIHWQSFQTIISLKLILIFVAMYLFDLFNAYPTVTFNFITSQPFMDQLFRSYGISILFVTLRAIVMAIMFSFVTFLPQRYRIQNNRSLLPWIGIAFGSLFAAADSVLSLAFPASAPLWANMTALRFIFPAIVSINSAIINYFTFTILLIFGVIALNALQVISRRKFVGFILFTLIGFICSGILYADNLQLFYLLGILYGYFFFTTYYSVAAYSYSFLPLATGSYVILWHIQEIAFNSFSGAILYNSIAIGLISVIAWWWYRALEMHN